MTAASGIVHEEFHSRQFAKDGGTLEMVQLWVNLPAEAKNSPPKYQDLRDEQFPRVSIPNEGGVVRVIAGKFLDTRGPAGTFTPINVWDVQLSAGGSLNARAPEGHTALLIVQDGQVTVNEESAKAVELLQFERQGEAIQMRAETASRVLVLTGQPLNEPVYGQGPFVMNSREEIQQAMADYQAGKMGTLT
jgi:redox-sensitive bicupin YhaK (pirin superfamily)